MLVVFIVIVAAFTHLCFVYTVNANRSSNGMFVSTRTTEILSKIWECTTGKLRRSDAFLFGHAEATCSSLRERMTFF
jgi:hypothetical protein